MCLEGLGATFSPGDDAESGAFVVFGGASGDEMSVIKFPGEPVGHSAMMTATRWEILQHRLVELLCLALQRLGVPGAIQNVEIDDPVTGQKLEIRVNRLSTRISIDGRDYYFERLSGRFSGAGYATQHAGCILE